MIVLEHNERKEMIKSVERINCDECYGHGVIFYGDDETYDIEPCECVA